MRSRPPYSYPIVLLFLLTTALLLKWRQQFGIWGMDHLVAIAGNFFVFLITLVSLVVIMKGISQANTMSFIRSVNIAFIVKFFLVVAAVAIYAMTAKEINRGAILVSMVLYLLYTFLEVRILLNHMKRRPDGEE